MLKAATILPTPYLHLTEHDDYHMCLAHLIGEDPVYTEFFQRMARDPKKYVIMDNGVMEGDQKSIEDIVRRANLIGADEIILPDVFLNKEETLEKGYEALQYVKDNFPFRIMAVPQADTIDGWLECATIMCDWDIHCLGIPKVLITLADNAARRDVLELLGNKTRGLDIHLLGCWKTPLEMRIVANAVFKKEIREVRGVDSAIAYVYTRSKTRIDQTDRPSHDPIDFSDASVSLPLLKENIKLWKDCCVAPWEREISTLL